jgi:hypothetical protein
MLEKSAQDPQPYTCFGDTTLQALKGKSWQQWFCARSGMSHRFGQYTCYCDAICPSRVLGLHLTHIK